MSQTNVTMVYKTSFIIKVSNIFFHIVKTCFVDKWACLPLLYFPILESHITQQTNAEIMWNFTWAYEPVQLLGVGYDLNPSLAYRQWVNCVWCNCLHMVAVCVLWMPLGMDYNI